MFIADRIQTIRNHDGFTVEDGMLEILDKMLTEYGVQHFFGLPDGPGDGSAFDDDDVAQLFYQSEDEITFLCVFLLWNRTTRQASDDRMKRAFAKLAKKYE